MKKLSAILLAAFCFTVLAYSVSAADPTANAPTDKSIIKATKADIKADKTKLKADKTKLKAERKARREKRKAERKTKVVTPVAPTGTVK